MKKTETEWQQLLTQEQFQITRLKGTEYPFTGELLHNEQNGSYHCVCCKAHLFDSTAKFDAGCGWPSFFTAIEGQVQYVRDLSHGMDRTEIICAACDAHLGHVFDDGPAPTGLRFCVNSVSLQFSAKK